MNKTVFTTTILGKLAKFTSGAFLAMEDYKWGKIPVYGGNGISGYHDKKLMVTDTIIFGRVGAHCGSVHISNGSSWITDNAIFIKELSNQINLEYLFRFLSRLNIRLLAEISAQPKIDQDILKHITVKFPSLKEQEKIASILSGVDATIEATQKVIEKTERLKKGLMQQLLTKGINHEKFKMVRWLFGKEIKIPKEWEIKQLISVSSQKPEYGSGDAALPYNSKLARYIRITDIDDEGRLKDEKVSVKLVNNKQYILNQDDFLFARTGSVGRTFVFSTNYGLCVYAGYLIRFKLNKRKILPIFLHYYTLSNTYWTWLTSELTQGVQPNVNAQQYSKLPIVLPSLTEQNMIASILSGVDAYIQKNHEYKKKLEELKRGLMQKLLTGQLRVKI